MDHSNFVTVLQQRLDWLKYLEYEALNPTDPKRALSNKTTFAQTKNFLRLSFGDQSPYFQNFNQLSFYYEEGKLHIFEQNKEIAIGILENALDNLGQSTI